MQSLSPEATTVVVSCHMHPDCLEVSFFVFGILALACPR